MSSRKLKKASGARGVTNWLAPHRIGLRSGIHEAIDRDKKVPDKTDI